MEIYLTLKYLVLFLVLTKILYTIIEKYSPTPKFIKLEDHLKDSKGFIIELNLYVLTWIYELISIPIFTYYYLYYEDYKEGIENNIMVNLVIILYVAYYIFHLYYTRYLRTFMLVFNSIHHISTIIILSSCVFLQNFYFINLQLGFYAKICAPFMWLKRIFIGYNLSKKYIQIFGIIFYILYLTRIKMYFIWRDAYQNYSIYYSIHFFILCKIISFFKFFRIFWYNL